MHHHSRQLQRKTRNRRGLTLLELVVVMTILIALAGILVALFPNILLFAHTSTGATNMPELVKVFHMHHATQRSYPNFLDNLTDGTDLYAKLPGGGASLGTLTLDADTAASLNAAGLTKVFNLDSDNDDATFECYGEGIVTPETGDAVDVAAGLVVARIVQSSDLERLKGHDPEIYVLFGVGHGTPLVGNFMEEAPVHFGHEKDSKPNEAYSRFAAVYRLGGEVVPGDGDDTADSPLDADSDPTNDDDDWFLPNDGPAEFITCVGLHDGGIAVPWMPIKGFSSSGHSH